MMVVGSDRVKEFEMLIKKYNGVDQDMDTISLIL